MGLHAALARGALGATSFSKQLVINVAKESAKLQKKEEFCSVFQVGLPTIKSFVVIATLSVGL